MYEDISQRVNSLLDAWAVQGLEHNLELLVCMWSSKLVRDPADAVLMDYGVSIGRPPRKTYASVPDLVLAFVAMDGSWLWPIRSGVAHNLHVTGAPMLTMPPMCGEKAYPIWITVGNMRHRKRLCTRQKHIDMFGYILQKRRTLFWEISFREFIETTWHPERVCAWCFDTEDNDMFMDG